MERLSITHGMLVRGPNGKKVGRIGVCGTQHFRIHRHGGDGALPYEAISSLAGGVVHLKTDVLLAADLPDLNEGPRTTVKPIGFLDVTAPAT